MIDLDVTITAIRRPDIFRLTAESFSKNLLRGNFAPRAILNIDPLGGTAADAAEVERVARHFFPNLVVRNPERAGFAEAVKWVWSQAATPWVLHLEDDWLLLRRISFERIKSEMTEPGVQGVRFYLRRSPLELYSNRLSLNPTLLKLDLIKRLEPLLDSSKDPEKQIPALPAGEYIRLHGEARSPRMVLDIGKKWRNAEGIRKTFDAGASVFKLREMNTIYRWLLACKRDCFWLTWRVLIATSMLRRSI